MTGMALRTVLRPQGNGQALRDRTVTPGGFSFDFVDVPVLVQAFRRMVRGLEFDVCEMAFTTYICAKAHGVRFTALPIFVVRAFHHGAIVYNRNAGVDTPRDLEGKRVGVNRGYTVTTGVWARSILQDEHGVNLDRVTWVRSGDEHVSAYEPPANVEQMDDGRTLQEMVASAELAAAVGIESVDHPDVAPLIPNAAEAGLAAMRQRGLYPINHTVVVRDELLAAHPGLARDVFEAFAEAKRVYVRRLAEDRIESPSAVDEQYRRVMDITGDPLPYGIEPNRSVIERLIGHAVSQKIIAGPMAVDDLFAVGTHDLNA